MDEYGSYGALGGFGKATLEDEKSSNCTGKANATASNELDLDTEPAVTGTEAPAGGYVVKLGNNNNSTGGPPILRYLAKLPPSDVVNEQEEESEESGESKGYLAKSPGVEPLWELEGEVAAPKRRMCHLPIPNIKRGLDEAAMAA